MIKRLSREDLRQWRAVAKTVKPRVGRSVEEFKSKAVSAKPASSATEALVPVAKKPAGSSRAATSQPSKPVPPPADRGEEKRVRRGRVDLAASLDLHGHTQDSARSALLSFLAHYRMQNARVVLIITGKGRLGGGVLRKRFFDWLESPDIRAHITSYAQSHQRHGGAGAFYVFLKKPPKRK